MHYEVEQKFAISNLSDVEARLCALGAEFQPPLKQADHYFRHPCRDFAQTDEALRLRQVGAQNVITYKGPKIDATTKTRRELELPLAAGEQTIEQFTEMLVALGFTPVKTVRKTRRPATLSWEGFSVEAALDQVDDAGQFLELEITADNDSLEAAKTALSHLASKLPVGPSERRSYLELVLISKIKSET